MNKIRIIYKGITFELYNGDLEHLEEEEITNEQIKKLVSKLEILEDKINIIESLDVLNNANKRELIRVCKEHEIISNEITDIINKTAEQILKEM